MILVPKETLQVPNGIILVPVGTISLPFGSVQVPKEIILVPKEMLVSPSWAAIFSYLQLALGELFSASSCSVERISYGFEQICAWHGVG